MVEIHSSVRAFVTDEATSKAHLSPMYTKCREAHVPGLFFSGKKGQKVGSISFEMTFARTHLSSSLSNHLIAKLTNAG